MLGILEKKSSKWSPSLNEEVLLNWIWREVSCFISGLTLSSKKTNTTGFRIRQEKFEVQLWHVLSLWPWQIFHLSDNEEMTIYVPNTAAGVRGNKAFRIRSTKPGTGEELSPCLHFLLTTGFPVANTPPRSHQNTQMTDRVPHFSPYG